MNMNGMQKIVCAVGVFLSMLPILGFPGSWENFFMICGGLSVLVLTLRSAQHKKTFGERVFEEARSIASQVFVERNPTLSR